MIYAYRKISFQSNKAHRYIFTRQFKNFSSEKFINDLKNVPWFLLARHADPESMWTEWKTKFLEVADKHAPLRNRRVHNKQSPWITADLKNKLRQRDYKKKIAIRTNDPNDWAIFKASRNSTNNYI